LRPARCDAVPGLWRGSLLSREQPFVEASEPTSGLPGASVGRCSRESSPSLRPMWIAIVSGGFRWWSLLSREQPFVEATRPRSRLAAMSPCRCSRESSPSLRPGDRACAVDDGFRSLLSREQPFVEASPSPSDSSGHVTSLLSREQPFVEALLSGAPAALGSQSLLSREQPFVEAARPRSGPTTQPRVAALARAALR